MATIFAGLWLEMGSAGPLPFAPHVTQFSRAHPGLPDILASLVSPSTQLGQYCHVPDILQVKTGKGESCLFISREPTRKKSFCSAGGKAERINYRTLKWGKNCLGVIQSTPVPCSGQVTTSGANTYSTLDPILGCVFACVYV